MDSMAGLLDGGNEEESLVPGDVAESFMITSIILPEDNDFHMPPKDKPQITPEELEVLKWWILNGAPEKKKLSEVETSGEITEAIKSLN